MRALALCKIIDNIDSISIIKIESAPVDTITPISPSPEHQNPPPESIISLDEANFIYNFPFNDLLFRAQTVHRENFDPNAIQMSRLLSIKTGGCAEDCGYCSQSAHYPTGLKASRLMEVERVLAEAQKAKEGGATRYCMGAAWRSPKERDMEAVVAMVEGVRALGMETCMTLGMQVSMPSARTPSTMATTASMSRSLGLRHAAPMQ